MSIQQYDLVYLSACCVVQRTNFLCLPQWLIIAEIVRQVYSYETGIPLTGDFSLRTSWWPCQHFLRTALESKILLSNLPSFFLSFSQDQICNTCWIESWYLLLGELRLACGTSSDPGSGGGELEAPGLGLRQMISIGMHWDVWSSCS